MKRFLWYLLLAAATALAARAQTAAITGPASPLVATGAVTVTGTESGATTVAISITNNATGTSVPTSSTTIIGATWSASFTPPNVGDYLIKATPSTSTTTGTAVLATLTISSIAPTVTLSIAGGGTSIPVGAARYLIATATDDGAISRVEFYIDASVLLGTIASPSSGSVYALGFTAPTVTGTHQLTAKAYDNSGNVTTSGAITIEVTTPVGNGPSVGLSTPSNGAFLPTGVATTVTGTVADSDGTVSSVVVFMNGVSIGSATVSSGTWSIAWTPSVQGAIALSAIAADNQGNAVLSPPVSVNVTDSSSPTIALGVTPGTNGATSTTLPAGSTRNVLVTAAAAAGRAVVRVEFFVNGTKVGEKTIAPYSYRYTAPAATGTYIFSARATDNTGLARDAQYAFIVTNGVGLPPTINLLSPTNGTTVVPNTVTSPVSLAASAVASGGSIASVEFYQNGNPTLNTTSANPLTTPPYVSTFVPTQPGSYVIDAIATDDRGNTTVSNAVTITAAFGAPTIVLTSPTASATARATPNVPLTITATATPGSGAAVLLVEFLLDGVQIGAKTAPTVVNGTSFSFAWTPTAAQLGAHLLTARVTDTNSQIALSAPAVNVNVSNVVGTPPSVTVSTQPVQSATSILQTLSTVNFIANAFASGSNTLTSVEFFLNDTSIGLAAREQTTNLYRLAYNFGVFDFSTVTPTLDANGNNRYALSLYAIAKDSAGNQTISTTGTLSVAQSTSAPPTVSLTALAIGTTTVAQGTTFQMIAQPVDPDGTVVSLQLYVNGAASGPAIANPAALTLVQYTPTAAGRFNLYVTATDDSGNTIVSTPALVLNATAVNAPTTSVTRPIDDSTVTTVGAPVFLEATANGSDPTQIPTVQFIPTASNGARLTAINAARVGTTNTYRAVWTTTSADTFTVSSAATVSGVTGNSANSRRVVVNNVIGIAPTITITTPASITSGSTSNLIATATSSSGSIASVEFFVNRNSIGQAVRDQLTNTWRLNTSFIGLPTGSNEVVALAHDSSGNIAASPTGTITITAGTGVAPSVTVFAAPASIALGQSVVLSATASSITGTVTSVTYFANATNLAGRTTPPSPGQAGYVFTWTNAPIGTFNVYAVATDSNNNTNVSAPVTVTVRNFTPLLDDDAFILQTYTDITNGAPSTVQFAAYDAQFVAGTITRPQLVSTLATGNANFTNIVNALAAYYVLMGQWPTTANYTTIFNSRGNLATVCGGIIAEPEYVVKYGITPTVALLDNPASLIPEATFLARLYQNAGLGPPSNLDLVQFKNNATAITTTNPPVGRGYDGINPVTTTANGLNAALSDFVAVTNLNNTALINLATAAALYYQLDKPTVVSPLDPSVGTGVVQTTTDVANHIQALVANSGLTAMAGAVLQDILYSYRFVTIMSQPQSLLVAAKSGALFRVAAQGQPPIGYQWLFNGAPIAGATNALLSLTSVDSTKAGTYTVLVSTANGSATSDPATLTLSTALTKLGNISTRGVTSAGAQTLIAGFVVTTPAGSPANQTRQMLIRVIGPGLAAQGFTTGLLADPRLEVYGPGSSTVPILTNDNWGTQTTNAGTNATAVAAIEAATTRTGAFALPNTASADAVVLATLAPGNYTVQAKGPANTSSGVVLIEVYDASPTSTATTPKPINVSTRGFIGTGANSLVAGFVINGTVARRMLIRGVGPTLANFGLGNAGLLADPQLTLYNSSSAVIKTNDDWASGDDAAIIAAASVSGGAFPLANGSKDAAMLVMLQPGLYTVQVNGANNTTGLGLVEVYDVDP